MIAIPEELEWWRERPDGAVWLARLPALVAEVAATWELEVGAPFAGAYASLVLRVRRADGAPAMLKVAFPEEESRRQADALAHWGPAVAAKVLAHDVERQATLLEHVRPGDALAPRELEAVLPSVLAALWAAPEPGPPFRDVAGDAARWREEIPAAWAAAGRPFPADLVAEALATIDRLVPSQSERVLCHQDLHCGNILRSDRTGWAVIDPLPVVAERAFDFTGVGLNHPDQALLRRLARATDVDFDRARGWAFVHALAWGYEPDGRWLPRHIEVAHALSGGR